MYCTDQSEKLVPAEAAARRKSTAYNTIWSIKLGKTQRQFSLDLTAGSRTDSPARPPPTPLPQETQCNSPFRLGSASAGFLHSNFNNMGHLRDPYAPGMSALNGLLPSMDNAQSVQCQDMHGNFGSMAQYQDQGHSFPLQAGYKHFFPQESVTTQNVYSQSQMRFSSTPNVASQVVLPHFSQMGNGVAFGDYTGMCQKLGGNTASSQPSFQMLGEYLFNSRRPSSAYPGSPTYQEDERSRRKGQIDLSPTAKDTGSPFKSSRASSIVCQELFSQLRRRSCGDSTRFKESDTTSNGRYDSLEISRLHEKVAPYFSRDPHEKVRVNYMVICNCLKNDYRFLAPEYGLPDFDLDEYLIESNLVLVAFKAGRLNVFYIPRDSQELRYLQEGSFVIVEADRGKDLGRIVKKGVSWDEARVLRLLDSLQQNTNFGERYSKELHLGHLQQYESRSGGGAYGSCLTLINPKAIIGLASQREVYLILRKSQDEEKALRTNLDKIIDTLVANKDSNKQTEQSRIVSSSNPEELREMQFIEFEYQFDRRKLTVDYAAPRRLDFRDLVRELFQIFKTRIWMSPVIGIPFEFPKEPFDRRQNLPILPENTRSRSGSSRDRSQGHITGAQHAQTQTSPGMETANPNFPPFNFTQDYVSDRLSYAPEADSPEERTKMFRYENRQSVVPRILKNDSAGAHDNPEAEERCVTKSLVDTLNL